MILFIQQDTHQPGGSEDDTIITLIGNKIFSFLGKILFSLNLNDILYILNGEN